MALDLNDIKVDLPIKQETIYAIATRVINNRFMTKRFYTANGSFTVPAGVSRVMAEICGPGHESKPHNDAAWVGRFLDVEEGQTILITVDADSTQFGPFMTSFKGGASQWAANHQWVIYQPPYGRRISLGSGKGWGMVGYGKGPSYLPVAGIDDNFSESGNQGTPNTLIGVPAQPGLCVITY